jgi:hypothetical protein
MNSFFEKIRNNCYVKLYSIVLTNKFVKHYIEMNE